ncbi:MAG: signal peptidase I [Chloroflexota bacterium]
MRLLREVLQTVALALVIYAAIQLTVQTNKVYGSSMEPGLHQGQYVLVNKLVYLKLGDRYVFSPPKRGDVVILRPSGSEKLLIKRVIGLPGDTVEISKGLVHINGKALSEPYIQEPPIYPLPPTVIPPGSYFVQGDNRNHSLDSAQGLGTVPAENIVGRAWFSFWPPSHLGQVPNFAHAW